MKYIYLSILFEIFYFQTFSQNIQVTYVKAYKNYKDNSQVEPKILKGLEYMLTIQNDESSFEFISSMTENTRFINRGGGNGIYYFNKKSKEAIQSVECEFDNKKYLIILKKSKWVLTNETKIVNAYTCFKAIRYKKFKNPFTNKDVKVKITAWYTNEIPVPFGPIDSFNLPGLVLETYVGSFYFIAKNIQFKSNSIVTKPKEGELKTEKEYDMLLKKLYAKIIEN